MIEMQIILSNITKRENIKVHLSELIMDSRFGISTYNQFDTLHKYYALSMNMKRYHFLL